MKNQAELLYHVLEARHPSSPLFIFESGSLGWSNNAAKKLFPRPEDTPHIVWSAAANSDLGTQTIPWTQPSVGKRWVVSAIPIRAQRSFQTEAIDAVCVVMEEATILNDDFSSKFKTWNEMAAAWEISQAIEDSENSAWKAFREMVSNPMPALLPTSFSDQLRRLKDELAKMPFSSSLGPRLEWKTWEPISDVWTESNPERLAIAVEEIVRNAIETGIGTVLLQAAVVCGGERCELRVLHRHHGESEAPKWPTRAGEPFVTTKPGHAGLGLPRARMLVFQQRGTLTWETNPYGTLTKLAFPSAPQSKLATVKVRNEKNNINRVAFRNGSTKATNGV